MSLCHQTQNKKKLQQRTAAAEKAAALLQKEQAPPSPSRFERFARLADGTLPQAKDAAEAVEEAIPNEDAAEAAACYGG